MAAAAVVVLLETCAGENPHWLRCAFALAAACLAHLALVVLALPIAILLRKKPAHVAGALGTGLAVLAVAQVLISAVTGGGWLPELVDSSMPGYVALGTPLEVMTGAGALVAWRWYHGVQVIQPSAVGALDLAGTVMMVLLAGLLLLGLWVTARRRSALSVAALWGLVAFLPLWMLWDVGNVEHMVAAVPLATIVIAAGLRSLADRVVIPLVGCSLLVLLVVNGFGSAVPRSRAENSNVLTIAGFVREQVPPDGLLLSLGTDGRLGLGLPYLSGRRVSDLRLLVAAAERQGRDTTMALDYWLQSARESRSLWAMDDLLSSEAVAEAERLGIDPDRWRRVVGSWMLVPHRTLSADGAVIQEPFTLWKVYIR